MTLSQKIGAMTLGAILFLVSLGPFVWPASPTDQNLAEIIQRPSATHLLGTDQYGRDVLARLMHGGRASLQASVVIVILSLAIGAAGGLLASGHGWTARLLTRIIDILLALPSLVIALVIVGALGIGMTNLAIAFIAVGWPYYARLVRGFSRERLKALDIAAARVMGVPHHRVILTHVLPHAARRLAATWDAKPAPRSVTVAHARRVPARHRARRAPRAAPALRPPHCARRRLALWPVACVPLFSRFSFPQPCP